MASSYCFPRSYLRVVESSLALTLTQVVAHQRGKRSEIPDTMVDHALPGHIVIVPLPAEARHTIEHERNARIVALVKSPGFQMFPARGGAIVMTACGHSVTCRSVDACFDALLALEEGRIGEADLDGREDGSQIAAMGAGR